MAHESSSDDPPESAAAQPGPGLLSGQLGALRSRFQARLRTDRNGCRAARAALASGAPLDHRALARLAHGLHGIAATFGYAELSARAGRLEALMRKGPESASGDAPPLLPCLD